MAPIKVGPRGAVTELLRLSALPSAKPGGGEAPNGLRAANDGWRLAVSEVVAATSSDFPVLVTSAL